MCGTDLSLFHEPVTSTFTDAVQEEASGLAADRARAFLENGFVTGIRLLNDDQVEELRRSLAELMDPQLAADPRFYEYHLNESGDPAKVLFHALGAWRVSPALHDVIFLRPMVRVAEQLLGGPVRFWHDQLFVKPALDGAVVEWHQDYSYWTRTKPVAHLTCWIGLDDSTEENGCVQYEPRSHHWDLLPRYSLSGDMTAIFEHLTAEQRAKFKPVAAVLRAGEASFHHPMTVHGSFANSSPRPRRAVVINFIRDGVVSDTDEPLLDGVPAVPKGGKLEGRFFPLLSR